MRKRPPYLQDCSSNESSHSNSLPQHFPLPLSNSDLQSVKRSSSLSVPSSIPDANFGNDRINSNNYRGSGNTKFPPRIFTSPRRSHSTGSIISSSSASTILPSNVAGGFTDDSRKMQKYVTTLLRRTAHTLRIPYLCTKLQKFHHEAMQKSHRYQYICYKTKPIFYSWYKLIRLCILELQSIRCTCRQKLAFVCFVVIYSSCYVYFIKMPIWEYEAEWKNWEIKMQQSVTKLMPPSLPPKKMNDKEEASQLRKYWDSNTYYLEQFPYLQGKDAAREYVIPIPDYELMGRIRTKLAQRLRTHAIQSCENRKRHLLPNPPPVETAAKHSLPVLGITVANDTPDNRYLRRILHTIDLNTVGSIVITWYDEQTEAQLVGNQHSLSHDVVVSALEEYILHKGFEEISWRNDDGSVIDNSTDLYADGDANNSQMRLADPTSLTLLSEIATSIQQFCILDDEGQRSSEGFDRNTDACRNELLLLRFPTNLGCSTGVNNPLFTHPTAPHWLVANYDIAFPSGVLDAMGKELEKTRVKYPDLAVHTYGYIYGRGELMNPWSNFVMTSCAVVSAGVWDENIFPAYYEDDDYRDRIRYIAGIWKDVIGDPDRFENVPQQIMIDTHLIRYQTDRNVSVAHGPLSAETYLSGTHETMKKVQDAEKDEQNWHVLKSLWYWLWPDSKKPPDPLHYESERWSLAKEVSNAEGFFRCKHGALPDAGKHGEDPLRYFGWYERFLVPFVNRTRLTRMKEPMLLMNKPNDLNADGTISIDGHSIDPSPWAVWSFNATRRQCVHNAVNVLLAMPPSEEKKNLTQKFKDSCSVC